MTQEAPLSNNPVGPGPSHGPSGTSAQPGQMTAMMRAVAGTGPKVLRIGLIQAGRVIEERIINQRTRVNVGSSEQNMLVISEGDFPAHICLLLLSWDQL